MHCRFGNSSRLNLTNRFVSAHHSPVHFLDLIPAAQLNQRSEQSAYYVFTRNSATALSGYYIEIPSV